MQDTVKDPDKKGSKRVYKNDADKDKQKAMEGKNTPFQKALRKAEADGKKTFMWEGKSYAARTKGDEEPRKDLSMSKLDKIKPKQPSEETVNKEYYIPKGQKTKGSATSYKKEPQGNEKILAKDITGKPSYLKRNKSSARGVSKRLKQRQRQRGY